MLKIFGYLHTCILPSYLYCTNLKSNKGRGEDTNGSKLKVRVLKEKFNGVFK